jgi:hypothetical protein
VLGSSGLELDNVVVFAIRFLGGLVCEEEEKEEEKFLQKILTVIATDLFLEEEKKKRGTPACCCLYSRHAVILCVILGVMVYSRRDAVRTTLGMMLCR